MKNKNAQLLPALLTMVLWGTLFPMVKLGFSLSLVSGIGDTLLFAGLRFLIAGAIIAAFSAIRDPKSYSQASGSILPILLAGAFAVILHYGFSYVGLTMTDSSKTAILKQTGALFYVSFSFLFIREDRPTVRKILAAIIGFIGIMALELNGGGGFKFAVGDLLIIVSSFCTVISNVICKGVFKKVSPVTATAISQFFGGAVLTVIGLILGGDIYLGTIASILTFAYIILASVVSYCVWYGGVKRGELSRLFIVKFTEPLFACVFSAFILGEDILKIKYLIAFLLISAGVVIAENRGGFAKIFHCGKKEKNA